jgi:hypothetical protein
MLFTDAMTLNRLHDDVQAMRVGCISRAFTTEEARDAHQQAMALLDQAETVLALAADAAAKREPQPTDEVDAEIAALERTYRDALRAYDYTLPGELRNIPHEIAALRSKRLQILAGAAEVAQMDASAHGARPVTPGMAA